MDPLTALSVAGTIVQFVDFGCSLLSEAHELYRSTNGVLTTNKELELVTVDLRAVVVKLQQSFNSDISGHHRPLTIVDQKHQTALKTICDGAVEAAEELIQRLDDLKVKSTKGRKWDSIRQAVRTAWNKKEVNALVKRLEGFKAALETDVLFSIRQVYLPQLSSCQSLNSFVERASTCNRCRSQRLSTI